MTEGRKYFPSAFTTFGVLLFTNFFGEIFTQHVRAQLPDRGSGMYEYLSLTLEIAGNQYYGWHH